MAPLKIIIVGGGIGGTAAAIGLARNGHQVTIYERSTTSDVGYAFRITPNSDRCLKYLGIDTVAGGAVSANTGRILNPEGQVVSERSENKDPEKAKRGKSVFAYRPQLHQQLMTAALESGATVKTGVKVTSVDVAGTAIVLEDGSTVSADLIIGADGVHSVVRRHVVELPRFLPRASTGHNALRFMLPKSLVQNDALMSSLVDEDARMFTWAGNGKLILVYPVDYGKQYNVTCTHPEHLSDKEAASGGGDSAAAVGYNQKVSLESVLEIYSDYDPKARRLFELADPDGFRIWKLLDMDEIPTWSVNRTVLLGDACHAVSPFGFSGASMAIEDAVTLSTMLPSDTRLGDISDRLKLYEETRKPRVGRVRDTSRDIARGAGNRGYNVEYYQFLLSHDAVEHAEEALERGKRLHRERTASGP